MEEPPHPWTDDELLARNISYRGYGLAVSSEPFEPDGETLALIQRRVEAASAAAELVAEAFTSDAEVRSLYGYGTLQETCVLKDPGYRPLIPLGRWDSFLFPGGPRFMEYNTDGAAGWHYTAALSASCSTRPVPSAATSWNNPSSYCSGEPASRTCGREPTTRPR